MINQKIVLIVFFLVIFGCKDKPAVEVGPNSESVSEVPSFDWLIGDWHRTNDDEGQTTFEQWNKKAQSYGGMSYTMAGTDTIWKENVILFENMQDWYLSVKGTHDSSGINFLLTDIKEGYFKCQNPENEFPKVIEYFAGDNQLNAKISGGGDEIIFIYVKGQ
jgi:hypothetical protein